MRRLAAALVLAILASTAVRAQDGPGPRPPGPGPGPKPGPRGGPGADPALALRRMQELRAGRVRELLGNAERAKRVNDVLEQHDTKKQAREDERARLLERIDAAVHALLEARVTSQKGDEVMLSVGSDELVGPGVQFDIRHGAQVVARVVVEKVTGDASVAKVVSRAEGQKIQTGDAVAFAGMAPGDPAEKKPAKPAKADKPAKDDLPSLHGKVREADEALALAEEALAKQLREALPADDAAKVIAFLEKFAAEAKALLEGK